MKTFFRTLWSIVLTSQSMIFSNEKTHESFAPNDPIDGQNKDILGVRAEKKPLLFLKQIRSDDGSTATMLASHRSHSSHSSHASHASHSSHYSGSTGTVHTPSYTPPVQEIQRPVVQDTIQKDPDINVNYSSVIDSLVSRKWIGKSDKGQATRITFSRSDVHLFDVTIKIGTSIVTGYCTKSSSNIWLMKLNSIEFTNLNATWVSNFFNHTLKIEHIGTDIFNGSTIFNVMQATE